MDRDHAPQRSIGPALLPWALEVGRTLGGLLSSYRPNGPVDARTRERLILAVSEVDGCRSWSWIHSSWADFLGAGAIDHTPLTAAVSDYARACAVAGRPVDPAGLADVLTPEAARAVRATVAQVEVSNLVGRAIDGLLSPGTGRSVVSVGATLGEVVAAVVAMPVAVPLLAAAGIRRIVTLLAPPVPAVDLPPAGEANLLVHLLGAAAPEYLANAGTRMVLLGSPVPVAVALRSGRTCATVRVGRGRMAIANGVTRDAIMVVDGDVAPLLRAASGALSRELVGLGRPTD